MLHGMTRSLHVEKIKNMENCICISIYVYIAMIIYIYRYVDIVYLENLSVSMRTLVFDVQN